MTDQTDRLGGVTRKTSADLTVDTLPNTDGSLVYNSALPNVPNHHGFMRVHGAWYGITNRQRYTPEQVVEIAKELQYDRIVNGLPE